MRVTNYNNFCLFLLIVSFVMGFGIKLKRYSAGLSLVQVESTTANSSSDQSDTERDQDDPLDDLELHSYVFETLLSSQPAIQKSKSFTEYISDARVPRPPEEIA